jgi:radical SAM protein with 4Fe4S-binding SPASM domain
MRRGWLNARAIVHGARRVITEPRYLYPLVMVHAAKVLRGASPRAASGRAGRIRQCSIKITERCNLRCHTCGQWGERGYLRDRAAADLSRSELTPERWVAILRDLGAHGHRPSVYFWGGEPMLYDGLLDLVDETARLGMPPSIATNGVRVAEAAERLVRAATFLVQVSVDGPDAATHNACRPTAGSGGDSFAQASAGLAALRAARRALHRSLPMIVTLTTLSHRNAHRLAEIYETFRAQADALVFYLGWWIDEESGQRHVEDFARRFGFRPSTPLAWTGTWAPHDLRALAAQLETIRQRARSGPPAIFIPDVPPAGLAAYYTDHAASFGPPRCPSIFSAAEVLPDGRVTPCRDYSDYIVGSLREGTLDALWRSERFRAFRRSIEQDGLMPACQRCCGRLGN